MKKVLGTCILTSFLLPHRAVVAAVLSNKGFKQKVKLGETKMIKVEVRKKDDCWSFFFFLRR
jgi:hypothetical protein